MQVDFAVELGRDDETLDFPWSTSDGGPQYYNLKRDPEGLDRIEEAARTEELGDFLRAVNAPRSLVESAKCDTWVTDEINPEEEIFGAPWKFGCYVDLLFTNPESRFVFEEHEKLLKELTQLLQRVPDIPAAVEFLLRRCRYHGNADLRDGFYVTVYVFGYGEDESKSRQQWGTALKLVSNAVAQFSSLHFRA